MKPKSILITIKMEIQMKLQIKMKLKTKMKKKEKEKEKEEQEKKKNKKNQKHLSVLYGNRAACYLALENYEHAIEDCNQSLQYDPNYIKVLFRRAQAYEKTQKYYDSQSDYKKILEIDKNMEMVKENIKRLEPKVKEEQEKQKKKYLIN